MKIEVETEETEITISVGGKVEVTPELDGIDDIVSFNEATDKWCYGTECIYDSKNEAIKAYTDTLDRSDIKIYKADLAKGVDEEKRLFKCVVLRPGQFDNDGINQDFYSEAVVEKGCHDFNMYCQQNNIQHLFNTDLVKVAESFIADIDYPLGAGEVLKGDWVMTIKVFDDDIWDMCKDGTFTGFSIGCSAMVEEVTDE